VFVDPRRTGRDLVLGDVTLLSPMVPRTILVIFGGFIDLGGSPWLGAKVVTSVSGDHGVIECPEWVDEVGIEAEMALVIGRRILRATADQAREAIFGYTCFDDATAQQFMDERNVRPFPDFFAAKSIDTFASMGPWVCTDLDDETIRSGLDILCRINGTTVQHGNTKDYVYTPSEVVQHVSRATTLYPGDVIALGTPMPVPTANAGDVVEIEVEGIGILTNYVERASPRTGAGP
jgi:2-keto-4-pentenoate hydratase/2-oxohepta-3-ene-1,7-dioic acid hydratase in catechol pathway